MINKKTNPKNNSEKMPRTRKYNKLELQEIRNLIRDYVAAAEPETVLNTNEANYVRFVDSVNHAYGEGIISTRFVRDIYKQKSDHTKKSIVRVSAIVDFINDFLGRKNPTPETKKEESTNVVLVKIEEMQSSMQREMDKINELMKDSLSEAKRRDEQAKKQLEVFQQKRLADEARIKQLEKEVSSIVGNKKAPDNHRKQAETFFKQRNYTAYQKTLDESIKSNVETVAETFFLKAKGYEATLQYSKALQAYQMAQQLQPEKPSYLMALSSFSMLLGDFNTPVAILQHMLTILRKTDNNEENIAAAYNKLGNIWREKNDYKKAGDYYDKALQINSDLFGEYHPSIVETLQNIGLLQLANAQHNLSVETFQKAMEISHSISGDTTDIMASLLNHQGLALTHLEQYEKALQNFNTTIAISTLIHGKTYPGIANALTNIGEIWRYKGKYEIALENYTAALKMNKILFKKDHPKIAGLLNNLGMIWEKRADFKKAIKYYQEALSMNKRIHGNIHTNNSKNLNNLGLVYFTTEQNDKAKECYLEAISILKKIHNTDHPEIARVYSNIGGVFYAKKDYTQALKYYNMAIDMETRLGRSNQIAIAYPYANMAQTLDAKGDYDQAIYYYEKAYNKFKKLGAEHPTVGHIYNNLGQTWSSKGDKKKSIKHYEMAISIFEKALGKDHYYTVKSRNALREVRESTQKR